MRRRRRGCLCRSSIHSLATLRMVGPLTTEKNDRDFPQRGRSRPSKAAVPSTDFENESDPQVRRPIAVRLSPDESRYDLTDSFRNEASAGRLRRSRRAPGITTHWPPRGAAPHREAPQLPGGLPDARLASRQGDLAPPPIELPPGRVGLRPAALRRQI